MRIDEFSEPADIDGTLSTTERTRFLTFGFDISLETLVLWSENYKVNSGMSLEFILNSFIEDDKGITVHNNSIIFEGQSALRFTAYTNVDLTGALITQIRYKKSDGITTSSFTSTIEDAEEGIMYYDVLLTTELDQTGTWIMWTYVRFADGRDGFGIPVKVEVNPIGELL